MSANALSKKQLKLVEKHQLSEYITDLVWSTDGDRLAIATAGGELAIWQAGELAILIDQNNYSLDCLGFSADGQWLAAAGQEGKVYLWQLDSYGFKLFTVLEYERAWVNSLAWHPAQNLLAFAVNRQVKIWDGDNQKVVANLDFQSSSVFSLAWHPNGDFLAASGHGGVKVWDKQDWSKSPYLSEVPGASLDCAWSSDGTYLASGNLERTISLLQWDNPPPWLMQGFPGKVSRITWSKDPNKPLLAAACQEGISIWQRQKDNWHSYVLQHEKTVRAIAFSPRSSCLASTGDDGNISLWQGKKLVQTFKTSNYGFSDLAWHPQEKFLAAGGQNGELYIYQKSLSGKGFSNGK
ncbi:MAG: WD40 repeat domain-containing protein [Cyanobacteria bacterium J06600_6]